jgi:hypothetical protein
MRILPPTEWHWAVFAVLTTAAIVVLVGVLTLLGPAQRDTPRWSYVVDQVPLPDGRWVACVRQVNSETGAVEGQGCDFDSAGRPYAQ